MDSNFQKQSESNEDPHLHKQSESTKKRVKGWMRLVIAGLSIGAIGIALWYSNHSIYEQYVAYKLDTTRDGVQKLQHAGGTGYASLLNAPPRRLEELATEARYHDLPLARAKFHFWQERSESGKIPPNLILTAMKTVSTLEGRIQHAGKCSVAHLPLNCGLGFTAGLNPNHSGWTFLGPTEVGGRTRAILLNPASTNELWVGSIAGGVWHSTNGADSFAPIDDLLANLVISTLVLDPNRPDPNGPYTIYAGTGEGFGNDDALRGAGILRTTDGLSWNQIPETIPCANKAIPCTNDSPFLWINRLAISPDGKTLLAATWKGIYRSADANRATWTLVFPGNIADVKFHPTDDSKAIAGGMDTGQAYYSNDGGKSWQAASHEGNWIHVWPKGDQTPSRVELTYAAADATTSQNPNPAHLVYASVDNNSGEVWRSENDGESYTRMDSNTSDGFLTNYLGDQGWYDNAIWAGDIRRPNFILLGGINIWKSNDSGKTLVQISDWEQDNSLHSDQHAIVNHPLYDGENNKTIYIGNDGGVYRTDDIFSAGSDAKNTNGWIKLNHNYGVTQFYGIAWNPTSGALIGGAQDNGTVKLTQNAKPDRWTEEYGGDGGYCASDPSDSDYLYGEYVYLALHRSHDGGKNAELINGAYLDNKKNLVWKTDPQLVISDSQQQTANFIAPFIVDPRNSQGTTIFAGGASLWRTDDAKAPTANGPHWKSIKPPVPGWNSDPNYPNYISAIAASQGHPSSVWIGYNHGELYYTQGVDQPNPVWTKVAEGGSQKRPARMVTRIVVDSKDPKIVYVTYGGYSDTNARDNVWKTKDGGIIWNNVSGTLPPAPVFALTINPQNHNFIYLGTVYGIFASEDAGAHWSLSNEGPTNCAVEDFTWMGNRLVAATHGRGAWTIDLGQ